MSGTEEVTVERLKEEIAKILEGADLKTTSTKKVRIQLEKIFANVKPWAAEIDKIVMELVEAMPSDEDDVEEEDSDSEVEVSPKKEKKVKKEYVEEVESSEPEIEEPEVKKPSRRAAKRKSSVDDDKDYVAPKKEKKSGGGGGGGKKNSGYTKPYKLSPELSELMGGVSEMPRHEVVKRVWALIKEKNLYDPSNRQFAICDKALLKVIGVPKFRTFGMMKYLKNHFIG